MLNKNLINIYTSKIHLTIQKIKYKVWNYRRTPNDCTQKMCQMLKPIKDLAFFKGMHIAQSLPSQTFKLRLNSKEK